MALNIHNTQSRHLRTPFSDLWREENRIETDIQNTREELKRAERDLRHTMSKVR